MEKNAKVESEFSGGKIILARENEKEIEIFGELVRNKKSVLLDLIKAEDALGLTNLQFFKNENEEDGFVLNGHLENLGKYHVKGEKIVNLPKNMGYRTGISFDLEMNEHFSEESSIKEAPERLMRIYEMIRTRKMMDEYFETKSRISTIEELTLCHDEKYVLDLRDGRVKSQYGDYYVAKGTFVSASLSCGSVLSAIDMICGKHVDNVFCCSRPPGHHALFDAPMGFCFFSNVAIASKYLKKKHGVKKILIVDWDGNSTQALRMDDQETLFISIHKDIYPGTGDIENIGIHKNTVNIQFENDYSDVALINAFYQVILPIASEFLPEFIIISCGFDAVEFDPYGDCEVQPPTFGYLTSLLMNLVGGKNILMVFEGGYNITQLPKCVDYCLKALRGHPNIPLNKIRKTLELSGIEKKILRKVKSVHSKNWNCFESYSSEAVKEEDEEKKEEKALVYEKITEFEEDGDGEESIFAPNIDINSLKIFRYGGKFIKFDKE